MLTTTLGTLLLLALAAYRYIMLVRIILSWVPMSPPPALRPAFSFIYDLTEPFLRLFRGLLPPLGGIDISPMIAFVVLLIAERVVAQLFLGTFALG